LQPEKKKLDKAHAWWRLPDKCAYCLVHVVDSERATFSFACGCGIVLHDSCKEYLLLHDKLGYCWYCQRSLANMANGDNETTLLDSGMNDAAPPPVANHSTHYMVTCHRVMLTWYVLMIIMTAYFVADHWVYSGISAIASFFVMSSLIVAIPLLCFVSYHLGSFLHVQSVKMRTLLLGYGLVQHHYLLYLSKAELSLICVAVNVGVQAVVVTWYL